MDRKTIIHVSESAQEQIKKAIEWRSRISDESESRDLIKGTPFDWKNKMTVAPESGKACQYIDNPKIQECIKGQYRLVYEIVEKNDCFHINLLIFCHTRQDYQTLLKMLQ